MKQVALMLETNQQASSCPLKRNVGKIYRRNTTISLPSKAKNIMPNFTVAGEKEQATEVCQILMSLIIIVTLDTALFTLDI